MTGRARRNTRPRDALGRPLPYGSMGVEPQPEGVVRSPVESLVEAQRLLDGGRPFHAHEVLEDAWKSGPAEERELWRGLAQLAVGITHAARGNLDGAARLVARGSHNVEPYAARPPHGLDLVNLALWAERVLADIEAAQPGTPLVLTSPRLSSAPDVSAPGPTSAS